MQCCLLKGVTSESREAREATINRGSETAERAQTPAINISAQEAREGRFVVVNKLVTTHRPSRAQEMIATGYPGLRPLRGLRTGVNSRPSSLRLSDEVMLK